MERRELNKKQLEIVNSNESKIIVQAAAASGKTRTLIEQVKRIVSDGADPSKMVLITFTNAAADEMKKRLGKIKGMFVGTIHSYANSLLIKNGFSTQKYIDEEDFNKFFLLIEKHPECIEEVDYLFLDEAQDTGKLQLQFILEMIKPKHFTFYGDIRQSIYEWNGARPDLFLSLMKQSDIKVYTLNQNYRNGYDILSFAKTIIDKLGYDYLDDSEPMKDDCGELRFERCSEENIIDEIMEQPQYGEWFILTRTNATQDRIIRYLKNAGIPCDTFKRAELTKDEFSERMAANTVKVLTIHTSKGLENKKVIVIGANTKTKEETRLSYVAATRAMDYLVWMKDEKKKKRAYCSWE